MRSSEESSCDWSLRMVLEMWSYEKEGGREGGREGGNEYEMTG